MIESYSKDGAQKANEGYYRTSNTDTCLGCDKTEQLILELAELRRM